jgi:8-hydroxy-5-deazaflavin:NADPH oxidoreductase
MGGLNPANAQDLSKRIEKKLMKIGIIGSGNIGKNVAKHFVHAGHRVQISNSRGPHSLAATVAEIGPVPKW